MTGIRRWERRRQVGRVLLFTRRDNTGCSTVGATVPRRGPGYPHAVARLDRYGRATYAWVVVGGYEVSAASASLLDSQMMPGRVLGRVLVHVGRRSA